MFALRHGTYIVKYRERGRLVGCADNVLQTARELLDDVTHGVRLWAGFQAGARPRRRAPVARAPVALHAGRQETLAHRLYHLRRHEAARLPAKYQITIIIIHGILLTTSKYKGIRRNNIKFVSTSS